MIEVELADGTVLEIDTADQATAVQAARKYMQSRAPQPPPAAPPVQSVEPSPYVPLERTPAVPRDRLAPEADSYYLEPNQGPTPINRTRRDLAIGAQGVAAGVGSLAGAPVDIASAIINAGAAVANKAVVPAARAAANMLLPNDWQLPEINDPVPYVVAPIGGSQSIRDAASSAAGAVGVPLVDPATLSTRERLGYNVNQLGTEALLGGGLIAGAGRAAKAGSTIVNLAAPYTEGAAAGRAVRPFAGDVAGGAGSGVALTNVEDSEALRDSPLAKLAATLLGGIGGSAALSAATSPARAVRSVGDYLIRDASIGPDPVSGYQPSRRVANIARQSMQDAAVDPKRAASNIADEQAALLASSVSEGSLPTSGLLSNDPGLIARERSDRLTNPSRLVPGDRRTSALFAERDRHVSNEASDLVQSLSPGDHVDPRIAQSTARRLTDQQIAAAHVAERQAAARVAAAQDADAAAGGRLAARRGDAGSASERLDQVVVDQTMRPRQSRQRQLYESIDPDATVTRSPDRLLAVADEIEASAAGLPSSLRARVLPEGILADIRKLAPKRPDDSTPMGFVPQSAADVPERPGTTFRALNEMRPLLAEAEKEARQSGRFQLADNVRAIKRTIEQEAEALAAEGGEAGTRAREALEYTRREFGPLFGQGEGGKLRREINRDDLSRTNTPPTATAGRFLKPGAGGKEVAADLRRILDASPSRDEGNAAARDYLVADLARSVVGADGRITPASLRVWIANRQGAFESFPEIRGEAEGMLRDVVNRRREVARLQGQVEIAAQGTKRTDEEIRRSALSLLLDADPKVAAARVFSSRDPQMAMREVATRLSSDPRAIEGWKKALSEHFDETLLKTNRAMTSEGQRNPSLAELDNLFQRHDKVLREVYGAGEMNALRTAHRLMQNLERRDVRATTGSSTAEYGIAAQDLRPLEIFAKLYFGQLKGGGIMRSVKLALPSLPGANDAEKAGLVIRRAWFDPELARHLLTSPTPGPIAARWNAKLARLLAVQQAGAETTDE